MLTAALAWSIFQLAVMTGQKTAILLLLAVLIAHPSYATADASTDTGVAAAAAAAEPTCSAQEGDEIDPNLQRMTFDIGYGEETFDFYIRPDISTFYQEEPGSRTPMPPKHVGFAGKFVNL